jgi:hypothetical protein
MSRLRHHRRDSLRDGHDVGDVRGQRCWAARRVLEEHGHAWVKGNVPTPASVLFTTAAIYRRL